MTHHSFTPSGVCSREINYDLEDGKIHNLQFTGGCPGNLCAIGRLLEGMDARKAADILRGTPCGMRGTSCTDQFARAIDQLQDTGE